MTTDLVFVQDQKPVTSSRLVAEKFGKRHDSVLRSINNLTCSDRFRHHNFVGSSYLQEMPQGGAKEREEYIMTKDGFTFLVMGFTGKEAARFKESYIEQFNRMEEQLKQQNQLQLLQGHSQLSNQLEAISKQLTALQAAQLKGAEPTVKVPEFETHATVSQYAKSIEFEITTGENIKVANACVKLCRSNGLDVKRWEDETTGYVYRFFPKAVLHKAFATVFND